MAAELHPRSGKLIGLSNSNRTAQRNQPVQEFNHGLVLSREPLRDQDVFTVRIDKKVNSWSGSVEIGVTALDPSCLDFPSSATGLKGGSWIVSGCSVLRDGRSVLEEYGPASGLPTRLWAVVDLYGKCTQVTVVSCEPPSSMERDPERETVEGHEEVVVCGVREVDTGDLTSVVNLAAATNGTNGTTEQVPELPPTHDRPEFPNNIDPETVLTEHQLFDVFNNAIVSLYRSEDEGGGGRDLGGGTGTDSGNGSRGDRGSSSGGGAVNSDSGGGTGNTGSTNNSPAGGAGLGAVTGGMTTNDALLFHEKCGTLIKLSNNNKTAERRRPLDEFNNGVVMTNRPLRHNEMFEVQS
ncbi:unnamed protein product [Coregonus sp. 'balchen']|nr:unnamed protein product [Coregonus sp. 'balchen']